MPVHYDPTARLLHWLLALALLGQLAFGWWMEGIPRDTPARGYTVNLHKSAGIMIGLLVVVRLLWRLRQGVPAWPPGMPPWQRRLATATHRLLYGLMLLVPLAGYLASNFSRYGVKFFNVLLLPPWGVDDKQVYGLLNQTHRAAAVLLMGLVVLHVLAALVHAWRRDGVLARMWLSSS